MRIAYIDSQNIHKWVLECGRTIDRARFYNYVKNKHQIDVIKLFFGYIKEFEWLYSFCRKVWFVVVFKETLVLPNWDIKGNVDIDIAIESINDYHNWNLTSFVLISSDGDYNTLVKYFLAKKILYKLIVSNIHKTSKLLIKLLHVNQIQDLQMLKNKVNKKP